MCIRDSQKTGKEVWKTQLVDTMKCGCLFTSPPLAVKGKVIYGSTQGGIAARGGGIFGVDQKTLSLIHIYVYKRQVLIPTRRAPSRLTAVARNALP